MRIHATNVTGMGSRRLVESLLPEIVGSGVEAFDVYLAAGDPLGPVVEENKGVPRFSRRRLPNFLSRFLEVTFLTARFSGEGNLLVLGDLPISKIARQTVFVHNPFLVRPADGFGFLFRFKYAIVKRVFARNIRFVDRFVVQTPTMRALLADRYNIDRERIFVVGQPPPRYVLQNTDRIRKGRARRIDAGIRLFYPARGYAHKNHAFLTKESLDALEGVVSEIVLTIDPGEIENGDHRLLRCVGELDDMEMVKQYTLADALLFLSGEESFGLPLVEAVWCDLPVVCPDLPYSRDILAENPYFFRHLDAMSFLAAVKRLAVSLGTSQETDWSSARKRFPEDWQSVAMRFIEISQGRQ